MDQMEQIKKAVEEMRGNYQVPKPMAKPRGEPYRSESRMWDYIIRYLCGGCGRPFKNFDGENREFYCYRCRKILYPEDVNPDRPYRSFQSQERRKSP